MVPDALAPSFQSPFSLSEVDWVVLTKAPVPGTVKTRLIPHIGEQQATDLYLNLLQRLFDTLAELQTQGIGKTALWVSGNQQHSAFEPWKNIAEFYTQTEGGLGVKMASAVQASLAQGRIPILIGVDVPMLDVKYLTNAAKTLQQQDLVISPAEDGGYGLLGMKRFHSQLFANKIWGTDSVYPDTQIDLINLQQQGLRWQALAKVWDVDEAEDVTRYHAL